MVDFPGFKNLGIPSLSFSVPYQNDIFSLVY